MTAQLAESLVIVRTILLASIFLRCRVSVDTILPLKTVALLKPISADWQSLSVPPVQKFTVFTFLALSIDPVDTHYLLYF